MFRAQSPNKNDILISERDKKTMAGGEAGEDKTARAPLTEKGTKRWSQIRNSCNVPTPDFQLQQPI